ncbi:MAG: hypothetical protein HRU26_14100 [Psychroserpens sp.]|nr:hypothetical protein [Psychroserpens sp.]
MKKSLFFLLSLMAFFGCGNDDDNTQDQELSLPPVSEVGANKLGCYIDDILFIPRDGSGTFNSPDQAVIFWGGYPEATSYYELDIHDFKSEKTASLFMHIHALDANGPGEYNVNESNGYTSIDGLDQTYMHCRIWRDEAGDYQNYLSFDNSGTITITRYSLSSRIVSGTFSGWVRNFEEPHDTIQITQGRFDFKWDTLDDANFP